MKRKYKYLLKNLGILTVSNFASKILVFLLVPLYTSILSTEEYGVYDLVVTTIQLLFPILTLNIVDAVMRFLMDENIDRNSVVTSAMKYVGLALITGGVFVGVIHLVLQFEQIQGLEMLIYFYYVSYILNQFALQFTKGLERVEDLGIAGVLSTLGMLLCNVFFLTVFRWGLQGFLLANIIAQIVPVVFLFYRVKVWQYINYRYIKKDLEIEMLKYCTPLIFTVVGWWVNSASDRYVVVAILGVSATGILSVAYKIPSIINTIQGIFIQAWQISAIKEYDKEDSSEFYGNAFVHLNAVMVLACAGIILLTRPFAYVLYTNDFFQAWQYVPFLVISNVINTSAGFLGPILSAKKNSKVMAMSAIWGAGINIFLNIGLVYLMGIQGATIATLISSLVIYQVRRNATKKEFYTERYLFIMVSWILLILQAVVEIYMQNYYIEVVIVMVLLGIYVEPLKNTVRELVWRK